MGGVKHCALETVVPSAFQMGSDLVCVLPLCVVCVCVYIHVCVLVILQIYKSYLENDS